MSTGSPRREPSSPITLRFGNYELDCARQELRRAGALVALQPTPLRVLLHLAEQRGRTVSRQELFDAVWPGVVVGDDALTRALMEARRAVGDDSDAQRVIRTLKGLGYRFVAEAEVLGQERGSSSEHQTPPGARMATRTQGLEEGSPSVGLSQTFVASGQRLLQQSASALHGLPASEQASGGRLWSPGPVWGAHAGEASARRASNSVVFMQPPPPWTGSSLRSHPTLATLASINRGERGRDRTFDLGIKSPLLYQLSYAPTKRRNVRTSSVRGKSQLRGARRRSRCRRGASRCRRGRPARPRGTACRQDAACR